jgi:hypothetical protein
MTIIETDILKSIHQDTTIGKVIRDCMKEGIWKDIFVRYVSELWDTIEKEGKKDVRGGCLNAV